MQALLMQALSSYLTILSDYTSVESATYVQQLQCQEIPIQQFRIKSGLFFTLSVQMRTLNCSRTKPHLTVTQQGLESPNLLVAKLYCFTCYYLYPPGYSMGILRWTQESSSLVRILESAECKQSGGIMMMLPLQSVEWSFIFEKLKDTWSSLSNVSFHHSNVHLLVKFFQVLLSSDVNSCYQRAPPDNLFWFLSRLLSVEVYSMEEKQRTEKRDN